MNLTFIKLDINIMDDPKIKFILRLPDGDKLFRFWIALLTLAMKSKRPGVIELGEGIPFTDEILANHFDLELTTVRLAIQTFQRFKMVEIWEDKTLFITNFIEHQQLDKIEKAREVSRLSSRKYREKVKLIGDGHVNESDGETKTKNRVESKVFDPNSEEFRLSSLLFNKIKERDTKHKGPDLNKWCEHIDKLHRIDKREYSEIESVILWCQENSFWQNNILSTDKLRKKFEQLYLSMKSEKAKSINQQSTISINNNFGNK